MGGFTLVDSGNSVVESHPELRPSNERPVMPIYHTVLKNRLVPVWGKENKLMINGLNNDQNNQRGKIGDFWGKKGIIIKKVELGLASSFT